MDTLYYSKNCLHCQKLLSYLAKHGYTNKLNFLPIDRRQRDQTTGQMYLLLDRGTKVLLPANVQNVPSLVCSSSQNFKVLVGNDIYQYINYQLQGLNNEATHNNGEPSGFQLNQLNTMSEQFTYYSMTPKDLSSKGQGGMRQLLNYVPASYEGATANNNMAVNAGVNRLEPRGEDYRSEKLKADDVDFESLQKRRNAEIAIPPLGSGGPNAPAPIVYPPQQPQPQQMPSQHMPPPYGHQPHQPHQQQMASHQIPSNGQGYGQPQMPSNRSNALPNPPLPTPYLVNI